MKLIGAAFCLAAACSVGLGAQTQTRKYKNESDKAKAEVTKTVEVKSGKEIRAVGCLMANPAGGGYILRDVGKSHTQYALVTEDDMAKYLDHRVQVTGRATTGDGKVKLESKTKLDNREKVGTSGQTETKSTRTTTTEVAGRHFLGVKSVKSIAEHCR